MQSRSSDYRPSRDEILAYLETCVEHPLINLLCGAKVVSWSSTKDSWHSELSNGLTVHSQVVVESTGLLANTGGEPVIPDGAVLGPRVLHSQNATKDTLLAFESCHSRACVIGAGKTSVDLLVHLKKLTFAEITWMHRGSIYFLNREYAKKSRTSGEQNLLNSGLMLESWEQMHKDGILIRPNCSHISQKPYRGGTTSLQEIEIADTAKLILIDKLVAVRNGCITAIEKGATTETIYTVDLVILCTGQQYRQYDDTIDPHDGMGHFKLYPFSIGVFPLCYLPYMSLILRYLHSYNTSRARMTKYASLQYPMTVVMAMVELLPQFTDSDEVTKAATLVQSNDKYYNDWFDKVIPLEELLGPYKLDPKNYSTRSTQNSNQSAGTHLVKHVEATRTQAAFVANSAQGLVESSSSHNLSLLAVTPQTSEMAVGRRALETMLSQTVTEVIGKTTTLDSPLLTSGSSSLVAVKIHALVQHELGTAIRLPRTLVFDYPSIHSMANFIGHVLQPSVEPIETGSKVNSLDTFKHSTQAITSFGGWPPSESGSLACDLQNNGDNPSRNAEEHSTFTNPVSTQPSLVELLRVPLGSSKLQPPLFLATGGVGSSAVYAELASQIEGERFVYGLENGGSLDIEALAQRHAHTIQMLVPTGNIHIGGYSLGGYVAVRVAAVLQEAGRAVLSVFVLDSYHMASIPPAEWITRNYLTALGVPAMLLEQDGEALQRWASRSQTLSSTQAHYLINYGSEFIQVLNGQGAASKTVNFPDGWVDDPTAAFSCLRSDLLLFNATLDMKGKRKDDTLWCSGCDSVTVIDINVNHMQLLEDPTSFTILLKMINTWFDQAESSIL